MVLIDVEELLRLAASAGEKTGDASIAALKAGDEVGSVTSSVLKFAGEHPYLTVGGAAGAGVAGITLVGATAGAISDLKSSVTGLISDGTTNPNANTNKFVVDASGNQVDTVKKSSDTTVKEDTGILGWFTKSFTTGLFGSQANANDFMTAAKPWLIGGAVLAGIVVVGYTVRSFRKQPKVVLS